jgi:signal peptidase II
MILHLKMEITDSSQQSVTAGDDAAMSSTQASRSGSAFASPLALMLFFGTTILGLALDLWTKVEAFRHLVIEIVRLPEGVVRVTKSREIEFLPGWLHFHATANQGAVFGIGQGKRWLFIVVSIGAIAFLTYLFSTSGRQRIYQFILGLLLAGVLGNMYDRIVFGYVRDMIYALPRWPNVFPWIFNVADSMLCVGVFLLIVYSLLHKGPQHNDADSRR